MSTITRIASALCATSALVGIIAADAGAATLPAASGASRLPGNNACFQRDFGRVTNTGASGCSGQRTFSIGTPVFTGVTGSRSFGVTGCSASTNASVCKVNILGADGWRKNGSADVGLQVCPVVGGTLPPTQLGTFSVAGTDAVVFECHMSPGSPTGTPQNWLGSVTY